ncbi:MAG: MFS transporter [Chloroflexi bacterium]|nr:MFS transporter [Chloroflexota bacterium]
MNAPSPRQHKRIVGVIWITYALFYLGRVNFSVVLPALAIALDASRAEVGALGTVFFWVYGIFHFISGEIGSHLSPFRMVCAGLLIIALVNIAFAFQTSLLLMLVLWGINGIGQSAGWAPMFRILAERLDRGQIKVISTVMPFSYVIGTAITWTLVGAVATGANWQVAFWLPGLLTLGVLAFWWRAGIDAPKATPQGFNPSQIRAELRQIAAVLLATALAGFVFNGMTIWLPTYILDSRIVPENAIGSVAAAMQVIAILGLFLARLRVLRSNQVFVTAAAMLAAAGFAMLSLTAATGPLTLLIICLGMIMLNGAFGLVVSAVPLLLAPPGRASSITGSINMMSNFFGGMAGFTVGGLVEWSGWTAVFGLWGALLLMATALIWIKRGAEEEGTGATPA